MTSNPCSLLAHAPGASACVAGLRRHAALPGTCAAQVESLSAFDGVAVQNDDEAVLNEDRREHGDVARVAVLVVSIVGIGISYLLDRAGSQTAVAGGGLLVLALACNIVSWVTLTSRRYGRRKAARAHVRVRQFARWELMSTTWDMLSFALVAVGAILLLIGFI